MRRTTIRRSSFVVMIAAVLLLAVSALPALAGGTSPTAASPHVHPSTNAATRPSANQWRQLAKVRAVTFKYRDVDAALADGYVPIPIKGSLCVEHPEDGAMGIHYINPNYVDGTLDPLHPELLVYFPVGQDRLRLVAVEYFTPDTDQPHPTLFDRPLDGPVTHLLPEIPVHYSLHAWVWFNNPSGVFAGYNPRLECPWSNPDVQR